MSTQISITAVSAKSLKNTETFTKQDPYMTLQMGDINKVNNDDRVCKTRVHEDGGRHATWGDSFVFDVEDVEAAMLTLEVFNDDSFGKDPMIGRLRISLKEVFARHPDYDHQFEETFTIIEKGDVSKTAGDVLLKFLFHNEAAAIAKAEAAAAAIVAAQEAAAHAAAATEALEEAQAAAAAAEAARIEEENRRNAEAEAAAAAKVKAEAEAAEAERVRLELEAATLAQAEAEAQAQAAAQEEEEESEEESEHHEEEHHDAPRRKKKGNLFKKIGKKLGI